MVLFFLLSLFLDNRGVCLATKVLSCFRGLFCDFVPVHPRAFAGRRLCCYKDHWCILEFSWMVAFPSPVFVWFPGFSYSDTNKGIASHNGNDTC
ncbi:hypothetical protein POPTR_002G001250v4 [Populus trichocarpa]|uniref:Uncharacterized protein n=1 Tax=Populus trichocarpa TaxID=3694 RepID=A0ACC0TB09_POPTR|nr:hypothetical protein POPTR_002G001250v4 [Populus trichocarpa]